MDGTAVDESGAKDDQTDGTGAGVAASVGAVEAAGAGESASAAESVPPPAPESVAASVPSSASARVWRRDRESITDRQLGVRVIAFVVALCVLVAGWAALKVGVSGNGSGSGSKTTAAAKARHAVAATVPPRLLQQIADSYTIPGTAPNLPWPSTGQSAVEVEGIGSIGTSGNTAKPVPIASVTKTMTAYLILLHHPLAAGESGPAMTVTAAEAAAYPAELSQGQSLVKVNAGEQLTERAALEALMLASADNVAKILARWDAGSISAFASSMNKTAAQLGMTHTTYTDPSGLDPSTVSTATDQIKLGEVAMQSAAFRQIVAEQSATVPKQGTIRNYNGLLGANGVIGIKTGSTSQAGGCLLFAAAVTVGGRTETVIGAVLGQPLTTGGDFLDRTLNVSGRLIAAAERSLVAATIAAPGAQIASVHRGDEPETRLGVASAVTVVGWPGMTYRVSVSGDPSAAALEVTVTDSAGTASLTTGGASPLVPLFSRGAIPVE